MRSRPAARSCATRAQRRPRWPRLRSRRNLAHLMSELTDLLDMRVDERTPARVTGSIAADERHHQPWGIVHGGLYTTAVESFATLGAYEAVKDDGRQAVGVSNVTDFLRPHRTGRLDVVATAIQQGR